jgi:nucleoside-diphosphate-sugar epimerase
MCGSRALVTGASGFIGSHHRAASRRRCQIHAVSRLSQPPSELLTWHETDLADGDAVRRLVAGVSPDVVFHLAGDSRAARDLDLVTEMLQANVTTTVNLLTAVAEQDTARVVLAGSLEEPQADEPPSSPYSASKSAAHRTASCSRRSGIAGGDAAGLHDLRPRTADTRKRSHVILCCFAARRRS